ncbi:MerC domain-containing protein [Alteromonas sp. BMJM2]|jgi:hypothetical protein|uniref:MerC domain-containing protein n=1 Tax=Alteromonas sp. BMJM2 TaxID=2954241 RepID=UPI0022B3EA0E|nr:MerC domain-containing protein [Alteromonas sp. BMJM2]
MKLQVVGDKLAIGLSAICVVHCLVLPVFLTLFPSVLFTFFSDEQFHQAILYFILPPSILVLGLGFRHHRNIPVLFTGIVGLFILVSTATLGHDLLGEWGEISLTVLGSSVIAAAHFFNAKLRHLPSETKKR